MKHLEIERRYLLYPCSVKAFLKRYHMQYKKIPIRQFYSVAREDRVQRYRQEGNRYLLTSKTGRGMTRVEEEKEIDKATFYSALAAHRGGIIEKDRYVVEVGEYRYEIDRFKKSLKGLNILEIEFPDAARARRFRIAAPFDDLVITEVTDNPAFSNAALSRTMRIPAIAHPLIELLKRVDRENGFLKASAKVDLRPYESGAHAVKTILYRLLKSVEANRAAILEGDDDSERLHQFRVAMRKMRALLAQMSLYFDPTWLQSRKTKLAELMRQTGPKRDIDVYLMQIPRYRAWLSADYHEGLAEIENYLRKSAESQNVRLQAFLRSEALKDEIGTIERFVHTESLEGLSSAAENPVVIDATKALKKRYRKILKKGRAIDEEAPAADYHALRIEVKKLRYLMEFFAAILEPEAYRTLIKKLKEIQTILGEHQDLEVQRTHLKDLLKIPEITDKETKKSIEKLRQILEKEEHKKRRAFREKFAMFETTGSLFRRMICRY